jgi:hypothetical protein
MNNQELLIELVAQRTLFNGDQWQQDHTDKQRKKFFALLNEAWIVDRPLRIAMYQVWTGDTAITTTKNLSKFVMSKMIDKLADKVKGSISINGLIFITRLALYTKANVTFAESETDGEWSTAFLPDM